MGRKIEKEEFLRFVPKLTKSQIEDYGISASKYDCVYSFINYFAIVELNGKYGLINKEGKEIVETKYNYVRRFGENFTANLEGKIYYFDKKGKEINQPKC